MTEATAAVVRQPGGDFTIETIEVEAPRAGEVRVRIAGVGLCHTDLIFRDQFAIERQGASEGFRPELHLLRYVALNQGDADRLA